MTRPFRMARPALGLIPLILLLALTALPAFAVPVAQRLLADGGIETSVSLARAAFPDGATQVVLGTVETFPDNLTSGVLQEGRPLLLTTNDSLDPLTVEELQRLGATSATLLGGTDVISPAVADDLADLGLTVDRLSGTTRIETAQAVAATTGSSTVLLARAFAAAGATDASQAFADSLTISAWSAASGLPVLLTQTEVLTPSTADFLSAEAIDQVIIVGGPAAVSDAVADAITDLGIGVDRVSGATRFDTAAAIAEARGLAGVPTVVLTEGQDGDAWWSGFTAAAYAGAADAPVLLSNGPSLPAATVDAITSLAVPGEEVPALLCTPSVHAAACTQAAGLLGADVVDIALDGFGVVEEPTDEPTEEPVEETPVTAAPELLSVQVISSTTVNATVRYTFDREINPGTAMTNRFRAQSPVWSLAEHVIASATNPVVGDPTSVDVELPADPDLQARLSAATVDAGAIDGIDGVANLPGHVPVAEVTLIGDRTDGPDLVEVRNFDPGIPAAFGDETVEFVFDEAIDDGAIGGANRFRLIPATVPVQTHIATGVSTGTTADDNVVLVEFTLTDAAWDDVARALVFGLSVHDADGNTPVPLTVDVNEPDTDSPDLVAVTLLPETQQAVFTFDEAVDLVPLNEGYFLYTVDGLLYGNAFVTNVEKQGPADVLVTYGGGVVAEDVVGARIFAPVESQATTRLSRRDSVALTRTFPLGHAGGPVAQSVERSITTDPAGVPTEVDLIIRFDQAIDPLAIAPFAVEVDGTTHDLTACTTGADGTAQAPVLTCTVLDSSTSFEGVLAAPVVGLPRGVAERELPQSGTNPPQSLAIG